MSNTPIEEQDVWGMEAPATGGKDYLKLETDKPAKIRLFGKPIVFHEKSDFYPEPQLRFASLCIYRNTETKTNEVKGFKFGWTVQKQIKAMVDDEEYGDPTKYDLKITKTGEKLTTKYSVLPMKERPLTDEEKALIAGCTLDLEAMYKKPKGESQSAPSGSADNTAYDAFAEEE
jgi:hypothetical protein